MIDTTHIDLNDLRLLLNVVEHGGYSAASRVLGIPKSTISQRIAALEVAAGTGLLRRTSRSLSLTEAGELLIPHARVIDEQAKQARQALLNLGDDLSGTLRISSSVAVAQFALAPLLPTFLHDNPKVTVRVDAINRYVDLIGEGYDMGLRAHGTSLKETTLLQRIVAQTPWCLAASPALMAAAGPVSDPRELGGRETLFFATSNAEPVWSLLKDSVQILVRLSPRLWSDDMATLRIAAIEGAGIVALPAYILAPALRSGQLVTVLADWCVLKSAISILTPPARQSSRLAKAFSDYLAAEFASVTRV